MKSLTDANEGVDLRLRSKCALDLCFHLRHCAREKEREQTRVVQMLDNWGKQPEPCAVVSRA